MSSTNSPLIAEPKTLFQMSSDATDVLTRDCLDTLARSSELFIGMPFASIPGGCICYGEDADSSPIQNPLVEVLVICGGEIDVDTSLVKTRGTDIITSHRNMKLRALGLSYADTFINGDRTKDFRTFDGLRRRLQGDARIGFNMKQTLDVQIATLVDAVPGCTHLLMSKQQRRHLFKLARAGIGFVEMYDVQGTRLMYFVRERANTALVHRIPILALDYDHKGYRILENGDIFAVRFGKDHLCGIQAGPPEFRDFGEISAAPVYRTRMEWLSALAAFASQSAALLTAVNVNDSVR